MKIKNKKRLLITILIVLLGFGRVATITSSKVAMDIYNIEKKWSYVDIKNFDKYKNDYNTILKELLKYKSSMEKSEYPFFYVNTSVSAAGFHNPNGDKIIQLKGQLKKSLINIGKSFYDSEYPLATIDFYKNTIIFSTDNTMYGIVYSINGNKPKELYFENASSYRYYVKNLGDNWYSVKGVGYIGE